MNRTVAVVLTYTLSFVLGVVVGVAVAGCGASRVPPRSHFQPKANTSTTVGLMRVHFADEIGAADRRLAEEAIRAHERVAYSDLHFAVVYHLGQSYPTHTIDVYVAQGETLGSRFMDPVEGRLNADGSVTVVTGRGAVVPALVEWAAHAWWAPLHRADEAKNGPAAFFWTEVQWRQADSVKFLKIARGIP